MPKIIFFIVAIAFGALVISDLLSIKPAKRVARSPAFKAVGPGCEGLMVFVSIVLIALFVIIGLAYY